MIAPPRWTGEQLEQARQISVERFRDERMLEPLETYLELFEVDRAAVEDLLELTVDLSQIRALASEVLSNPELLRAVRYLSGPPISVDDLRELVQSSLSPKSLRENPDLARKVLETVLLGLDRNRFPWISEDREPTDSERSAATIASAALIASQRAASKRRSASGRAQEAAVTDRLKRYGLQEVRRRVISTLEQAPAVGEFCGESLFGDRKADIVIRLWDGRVMPVECKVSNSATNSVKRLNNDAAVKAGDWIKKFGTLQTSPAAVLAGVFKRRNLEQAQDAGLTLFWAHALDDMVEFIDSTRP